MIEQTSYNLRMPAASSSFASSIVRFVARASLLVILGAACGCLNSTPPPSSAFSDAIDLRATVDKCSPKGMEWNDTAAGGGILMNGRRIKFFRGDFQCDREKLDRLVEAVKGELTKGVELHGGRVVSWVPLDGDRLGKAIERRVKDRIMGEEAGDFTGISGFQIDYETAAIRGQLVVIAARTLMRPHKPLPLTLAIDIYESR
jgi:hypothetical protein